MHFKIFLLYNNFRLTSFGSKENTIEAMKRFEEAFSPAKV